jgi:hybrid cluster-associated redox disulfide protein
MIDKNTPIIEVLRAYPEARNIFVKHGMGCIGCMGAVSESIENGAKMHDIDINSLLKELQALELEK